MKYSLTAPQSIHTDIKLPASKSISNRALILNALSYSSYTPENLSDCDDTRVMINAFNSDSDHFDIGAAGTSMRFLTAFLSKIAGIWHITGSQRMKNRPIGILVEALRSLGADIQYTEKEGFPPLRITGKALKGGELRMNGSVSSQFISALLMIAPTMQQGLTLILEGKIISVPYIRMTLAMLKEFGIESQWQGNTITIQPQEFRMIPYRVESDWSGASYWYEIVSLLPGSEVFLEGLRKESFQGDSRIAEFFAQLGVETVFEQRLINGEKVSGALLRENGRCAATLQLDLNQQPDLAQTLVTGCALKGIPFCFTGLESLKIKETDRILALKQELLKLGYIINDRQDSILEWDGSRCQAAEQPLIETYEDHRMAMAFAPAAICHPDIIINNPQVVSKSYPAFWKDLEKAGFHICEK